MRRVVISQCHDPGWNLAFEEYLIGTGDDILYLWQNQNTVVIGRNQNPYKECNLKAIREDNIKLVRRKSGGGAVFHDLGNLNFTIISALKENNAEENFQLVKEALATTGVDAQVSGRNDIICKGKKISGNAFVEKDNRFCHHGTMLIDVKTERLKDYLNASELKLKSKGVDSVKSRVINLKEIHGEITVKMVEEAFEKVYRNQEPTQATEFFHLEDMKKIPEVRECAERYHSWHWTYGESPEADVIAENRFNWGIIETGFSIKNGIIEKVYINTDSIIPDGFSKLSEGLKGKPLKKYILIECIKKHIDSEEIQRDLIGKIEKY